MNPNAEFPFPIFKNPDLEINYEGSIPGGIIGVGSTILQVVSGIYKFPLSLNPPTLC